LGDYSRDRARCVGVAICARAIDAAGAIGAARHPAGSTFSDAGQREAAGFRGRGADGNASHGFGAERTGVAIRAKSWDDRIRPVIGRAGTAAAGRALTNRQRAPTPP
jgi:hypothetical protein